MVDLNFDMIECSAELEKLLFTLREVDFYLFILSLFFL